MKPGTKKNFGRPYLDSGPNEPRSNLIYKKKLRLAVIPEEVEPITQERIKEIAKSIPNCRHLLDARTYLFSIMSLKFVKYKNIRRNLYYSAWQRGQLARSVIDYLPNMEDRSLDIEYPSNDELLPRAYNTGHFGFTDNEIVSLRCALEFCVRKSLLAITASLTAFANFMDAFELWFGKLPNGALKNRQIERVVTGVMKMYLVLSDPTQFITFIDMRHQNVRHGIPNSIHRPAPGLSTCYGKSYTEFAEDKYPAYPPTPEGLDVPKHLPTQGMRILVGEHMMHPCQSVQTKALIIYHELTHKILGTLDKGLGFLGDGTIGTKPIFGEDSVQQMAKDFPEKTLLVADCWANFVIYFGE